MFTYLIPTLSLTDIIPTNQGIWFHWFYYYIYNLANRKLTTPPTRQGWWCSLMVCCFLVSPSVLLAPLFIWFSLIQMHHFPLTKHHQITLSQLSLAKPCHRIYYTQLQRVIWNLLHINQVIFSANVARYAVMYIFMNKCIYV